MRFFYLLTLVGTALAASGWKTVNIDRIVDVASQIVKVSSVYTFEHAGSAEKFIKIALTKEEDENLAYISVQIDGSKGKLKVNRDTGKQTDGFQIYNVDLQSPTPANQQMKIRVNLRITKVLQPLPTKVAQADSQFVLYQGNAYVPSAYDVATQKTIIRLTSGGKTLSATTVAPSKQETERVTYGPYQNTAAFQNSPIKVHYENNSPFVVATVVERLIEVSHWGNIAVEEYIELVHKGAELDGTFSRLDFQMDRRGRRMPALQQFTTVLPASARDIYYRDEIGNISTSAVKIRADSVELDVRPRFPLFGGWKTSYIIGYNLPSEEYLYNKDNQYALKMKLFDNVFENIVVEKLVTKIILPEHISKVKVTTPYPVERKPDELKPTYLDTTGRLVVILEKYNLVSDHIQSFTISYEFEFKDMLREPLLASLFFLVLFSVIIIYARFDFTIVTNSARDTEEYLQKQYESFANLVNRKQEAYERLIEAASEFKLKRNESILTAAKSEFVKAREAENNALSSKIAEFKSSPASSEKAAELLKYDKAASDTVDNYLKAVEKSTTKSAGSEETQFINKIKDARKRADSLLAAL